MNTPSKPLHRRWVGILLGLILPGSAHFLSGSRPAGIKWLAGLLLVSFAALCIAGIPIAYAVQAAFLLLSIRLVLWFLMLKQSFRPVRRIGFLGWLAVLLISLTIKISFVPLAHSVVYPFKMPFVSMQPTLRGVTVLGMDKSSPSFLNGRFEETVCAKVSGQVESVKHYRNGPAVTINGIVHQLPIHALSSSHRISLDRAYAKGDVLWSAIVTVGDHIMVERISYLFHPPKRGDIVVVRTGGINHPEVREDTFYVKRIVGIPGDEIAIDPPHVVVNGTALQEPEVFKTLAFANAGEFASSTNRIQLKEGEYFILGDNSNHSLDSRYFGPVPRKSIIGKVTNIYWPVDRIGQVD